MPIVSESESKPVIVLSGVNIREAGSLSIYRDAVDTLQREHGETYTIVALVKSRELFHTPGVRYLEFPKVSCSWLARVWFEYWSAKDISRDLKPKLWVSMHDMTPNVAAEAQVVYCHNPSPFYRVSVREFLLDHHFGMFSLFYRHLYRINLTANRYVIVQQDWIRQEFQRMYGLRNLIVAHPEAHSEPPALRTPEISSGRAYRFFYPMFPRTYKNPEVLLRATRLLQKKEFPVEIWITVDATINRYAKQLVKEFADVASVRWLGQVPRTRIQELYEEADCLVFPSRLETWGLPLTEFRPFGKPILVADLPYAHETCAGFRQVKFFDPEDEEALAEAMMRAATKTIQYESVPAVAISQPFAHNWSELWAILLR
jgi:glycosyltransferase involved in cell wall biosynthesis